MMLIHPSTQRNQLDSPLLGLPAEIRNQIHEEIFGGKFINSGCGPSNTTAHRGSIYSLPSLPTPVTDARDYVECRFEKRENQRTEDGRPSYNFALLKVCRQINSEARVLPLQLNIFNFPITQNFHEWKVAVGALLSDVRCIPMHTTAKRLRSIYELDSPSLSYPGHKNAEVAVYSSFCPQKLDKNEAWVMGDAKKDLVFEYHDIS
jgi:hypothetical protein